MQKTWTEDISGNERAHVERVRFAASAVVLYGQILQDGIAGDLKLLLTHLNDGNGDIHGMIELYGHICRKLYKAGIGLKEHIIEKVLYSENAFTQEAEIRGAACLDGCVGAAVKSDLIYLQAVSSIRPETLKKLIAERCKTDEWQREAIMSLPAWKGAGVKCDIAEYGDAEHGSGYLKNLLMHSTCWPGCAKELAGFHHKWGSGIFSKYRAFVWREGENGSFFDGAASPDPITFSDMISYTLEREVVIENTLRFLEGYPANNILLYGDRGTGKSSTVKALANEYYKMGLRIVEVSKRRLMDFPLIVRQLAGRNLKFILFIDDLSFEDNEDNYTALKAVLEGGLESKPKNVLIYATSNRKNLIKEKFSDRAGLVSGNADDEVRAADTMQEKLSLSDRFGITVVFSSPDKKRYLEIVEGIVKSRGLKVEKEFLYSEALKWELRYNGRSPRTAKQFVDWLEGCLS